MTRRGIAKTAAVLAAVAVLAAAAGLWILQSNWFYNQVRERVITTAERATGGRVEIGSFRFNWKQLRADVTGFTLHGTEPAGKPPLLRAARVGLTLKIVSIWKRDVDLQALEVSSPEIYLIVAADGSTNLPSPKVSSNRRGTMETLLRLAINRFAIVKGGFTVDSRGRVPFSISGQNLNLNLNYDSAAPRYFGHIAVDPVQAQIPGVEPTPWTLASDVSAEKDHIAFTSAKLASKGIDVQLTGQLRTLAHATAVAKYAVRADVTAAQRLFRIKLLDHGTIEASGEGQWKGGDEYAITGAMHAYELDYYSGATRVSKVRADGSLQTDLRQIELTALRYSAEANGVAVAGRIQTAALRGSVLDLRGVEAGALGGVFQGKATLLKFDRFSAEGKLANLDIRRAVALYSGEPLPWDGLASGDVQLDVSLNRPKDLAIAAGLDIAPAPQSQPVRGHVAAKYSAAAGTLDLGNSTLSLPRSRLDFSGALGGQLRVHLESRDLNDFLPAFGKKAADLPVRLANGAVTFDGTASGRLDRISATGHLTATHAVYNDEALDSLTADVTASPTSIQVRNATAVRGPLRAQIHLTAGLNDWALEPASPISGSATLHNAAMSDVAAALRLHDLPASGSVDLTAQISGTYANPQATAEITATKGAVYGEPFDRFLGNLTYDGRSVELASGEIDAQSKRLALTGAYTPAPDHLDSGRLRFQVSSNSMPLAQIHLLQDQRPGAQGQLQFASSGTVDLTPPAGGRIGLRVDDLHVTISALGLRLGQQPFGDIRLTANSENGVLRTHLESNFADSSIQGEGQWQLTGDYPGSSTIQFSKLDFAQLRTWVTPAADAPAFSGAAEGSLRIQGDALKPASVTAELNIPKFQIAPPRNVTPNGSHFVLTNAAPIVARLANSTVTVESARFTGPSTDLSITGKAALAPKVALDLHAAGQIDLGFVHELDKDFIASGAVNADAAIRGDLVSPQVTGRVQFQNATFNATNFPNGISQANGSIVFSGSRATIQDFTGQTGGGKIELTGFATYDKGEAVFRLHARAQQVRVRKPEGLSTVADADLTLSGDSQRSLLSGAMIIQRVTFNPESDFSSLIASSAQPVQTPVAETGFLAGLTMDVQISSAPDIQVQSTLTQDVQVEANLRLRGTVANPAMLGRVTITQGQLTFFGTKYQVSDGSISFFNPVKIAPVLDIDLTTKAQGVEVTLTISGPIDHLTLTPSSDSSLNYNDIISLLVTGRPPTSDPALLSGQNALGPGAFQQLGASALLGQAIAAPVTGRLQRFFGVSSLRIDPTIPGIDANPQARLTLQQQVTPNITFTYITSVTTTNPQIVQVEWALNSRWSVVALREENGETGLDFYFKKKF